MAATGAAKGFSSVGCGGGWRGESVREALRAGATGSLETRLGRGGVFAEAFDHGVGLRQRGHEVVLARDEALAEGRAGAQ